MRRSDMRLLDPNDGCLRPALLALRMQREGVVQGDSIPS